MVILVRGRECFVGLSTYIISLWVSGRIHSRTTRWVGACIIGVGLGDPDAAGRVRHGEADPARVGLDPGVAALAPVLLHNRGSRFLIIIIFVYLSST